MDRSTLTSASRWVLLPFLLAEPLAAQKGPSPPVEAVVLGIAQDGGVPQWNCHQELCEQARADPSKRRLVASLGLIDGPSGQRFLIDATTDFRDQVARLGGPPDAILLTHAHVGHYLGLAQLGREVAHTRALRVLCTASMAKFLRFNQPWRRLAELGNISIEELLPGKATALTARLHVTPILVPHRDEDSDTVAFLIRGPSRSLLWLPDIDRWEKWDRSLRQVLQDVSIAYLDGTFSSADEIPGRSIAEIPHPLVPDTVALLNRPGRPRSSVFFVHLNHTNRLLWDKQAVAALKAQGFFVAREGTRHPL
jgi:pyrroloquinoline quinone biosynthesis protein B